MPDEPTQTDASGGEDFSLGVDAEPSSAPGGAGEEQPSQTLEPIRDSAALDRLAGGEEEPAAQESAAQEPAAPRVYRFDGKEFTSPEEAYAAIEQAYKTREGRIQYEAQKRAEAERLVQQQNEWIAAQQAAAASHSRQPSGGGPDESPEAKDLLDAVDWERVGQVGEKEGFIPALQEAVLYMQDYLNTQNAKEVAPLREAYSTQRAMQEYQQHFYDFVMSKVGAYGEDGQPMYPELNESAGDFNAEMAKDVLDYLQRVSQQNPAFAVSDLGFESAVTYARHKALAAGNSRGPVETTTVTGAAANREAAQAAAKQVARDAQGRFTNKQRAAAKGQVAGEGVSPNAIANAGPASSMSEAELKRRIRGAGGGGNAFLGVHPD